MCASSRRSSPRRRRLPIPPQTEPSGLADLAFARSGEIATCDGRASREATLADAVADLERRMIAAALAATGNNHSASARQLGLSRVGLLKMMGRLGLR